MFGFRKKNEDADSGRKKVQFSVSGMHCVSCGMNIDGELEDTAGVISSSTNYAKATCSVEYDPKKVTESDLTRVITKLGYTPLPVTTK